MSKGSERKTDAQLVRDTLMHELKVHVRIQDQGHDPDETGRQALLDRLPDICAFGDHTFAGVRVVMDWDHQIPSQFILLRILACYEEESLRRVDAMLADRDEEIDEVNLYPEFDVPDYGEIEGSETYVAVMRPGNLDFEDFRFSSTWRKKVAPAKAEIAVRTVRGYEGYRKAAAARTTDGLGGPVVIGWAPPFLADTDNWAIEIWLLTEFDGHSGKARVFMVDTEAGKVTKEFDTDVQLA